MAHTNFIPTLWEQEILKTREDVLVAAKLCNRDYEGVIKKTGDKVKINGVSRPEVYDYDDVTGLKDAERPIDQSTMLEITESKAFNFYVGDIDKRQAAGDLMSAEKAEAAAAMAQVIDTFIYSHWKEAGIKVPVTELTSANIFSTVSTTLKKLWENKVPRNEKIYLEATPNFIEKLMLAKVMNDTNNSSTIAKGAAGTLKMFNIDVFMTTNAAVDSTLGEQIFVRTKKAISFADQISEIEAYRPEKYFGDAIKGLQVYGAKVVRPTELAVIQVKEYGEETNI